MQSSSSPNGKRERVVVPSASAGSALDAYVLLEQQVRARARVLAKEGRSSSWTVTFIPIGYDAARVVVNGHITHPQKKRKPACGARCRSGQPCRAKVVTRANGSLSSRCRLHGGLSTGPQTAAGRERVAQSNRERAKRKREAKV